MRWSGELPWSRRATSLTGAAFAISLIGCALFGMDLFGALVLSSPSAVALLVVRRAQRSGVRAVVLVAAVLTWAEVVLLLPFWFLGLLFLPSAVLLTVAGRRPAGQRRRRDDAEPHPRRRQDDEAEDHV